MGKLFMKDGNHTYLSNQSLNIHPSGRNHSFEPDIPTNTFQSNPSHYIHPFEINHSYVSILQADGNDTLDSDDDIIGLTEDEIYEKDPALVLSGYTFEDEQHCTANNKVNQFSTSSLPPARWQKDQIDMHTSSSENLNYAYAINEGNQSRRLLTNANKSPMNATYNDYKILNGKKHATNVNVEFNAGLYLSAIKPALQVIHEGWKLDVHGTTISCLKISDRSDKSKNLLVCTQLTLSLTNLYENISASKVFLHLYHTDNKIQVQGSSILSNVSTPVWMVEHFLQPLADQHLASQSQIINDLNHDILYSNHEESPQSNNISEKEKRIPSKTQNFSCGLCKSRLDPFASNPKDQTLSCDKCNRLYHKKCTDRRKTRANWKKAWFCQYCILHANIAITSEENSALNPSASVFHPTERISHIDSNAIQPSGIFPNPASNSTTVSIPSHPNPPGTIQFDKRTFPNIFHPVRQLSTNLIFQPGGHKSKELPASMSTSATQPFGTILSSNLPPGPVLQPSMNVHNDLTTPKFPTTSTRQRGSNINVNNSEIEFLNTALNACRGTISQQEVELKNQKESLEIRNKRIMQLENQVGHASKQFASRDIPNEPLKEPDNNFLEKIVQLVGKLCEAKNVPSTNIVINPCQKDTSHNKSSTSTQTDLIELTCNQCEHQSVREDTGNKQHNNPPLISDLTCEACGFGFATISMLSTHRETCHESCSFEDVPDPL